MKKRNASHDGTTEKVITALRKVPKAFDSLMGEYVSRKGPATDWQLVNECLLECEEALSILIAPMCKARKPGQSNQFCTLQDGHKGHHSNTGEIR